MNRVNLTDRRILRISGGAMEFPGRQQAPPQQPQTTSKKRKTPTPAPTQQMQKLNQKFKKMKV